MGDRGSGKRTAALVCAAAVLCEGADKPCGACKACKQVFEGVHPDLVRLGAEGASSIGIAAVRSLQETMRTKPYESKRRAILLEDAQLLTQDAQNALLKTLEEPQEGNVLFLLCTQLEGLLPTVQSRCRLIRMGRLSKEEMRRGLADRGVPPERVEELFAASGGNLGRALEMYADPDYARMAERCVGLLEGLRAPRNCPGGFGWPEGHGKGAAASPRLSGGDGAALPKAAAKKPRPAGLRRKRAAQAGLYKRAHP